VSALLPSHFGDSKKKKSYVITICLYRSIKKRINRLEGYKGERGFGVGFRASAAPTHF